MEFGTGALGTLLPKLGELLLDEYNLHKGLKKGIKDLMDELLVIQAALVKVSDVPLDQLDPLVKIWANDVRELSYAIEDSLDSFMVRVEGVEPTKPHTFLGYIKKTRKKVTRFKTRREIANDIKDIKIQVREVKERYDRYKDVIGNTNARTEVDPRLFALYNKASDLVGIDEAIKEVMKILSYHTDASNNELKTISIVGPGGLGKTTLAKVVYDKLNNQFIYGAFVPVGQNPDMKKVLRDILHEFDKQNSMNITASKMDVRQLINMVRKFLEDKRYFIVIDDIWDIPTWEILKRALVDSNSGSRIITTTRIVEVAKKVGGVYNMKPLSDVDSECLFYTRTCGGEGVSSAHQPTEVTNKIIKKCGGVPLAIITIASLLVGKRSEDWSEVYDAIGFGHEENEVVHNTRKILSFSYYDLPSNLKTCLLYLSMFPEDRFIEKNSLIWRWVSEGFVPNREGIGSFELGETYFNELVNKSMIRWIEPAEDEETTGGCRVHDMVLDLIRTISKDVNFVTVHDREQHSTYSRGKRTNVVRRLAHHGRSVEHRSSIELEHVRSFNAISCSGSGMPLLFSFKVLRVLVIEDCGFWKGYSLEHLGKLVQLRYLGLVNTSVKLPQDIGHDLKFLEILDVRGRMIRELPPSIGELRNLRCLWADGCTEMKGQIGKLTSLEELQLHSVDKCPSFWTEVGKLTKLRVLKIYFSEMEGAAAKALVESLCNLHKIQSLKVNHYNVSMKLEVLLAVHQNIIHGDNADSPVLGGSLEHLAPSSKLRLLTLPRITIHRVPSWINSLCVPLLSHLWLHVEVVEEADIQSLGSLPSLYYLVLLSEEKNGIPYTIGSDGFHKLRRLVMKNIEISIGEGALPMLEILLYSASARRKDAASLVPRNNSWPFLKRVTCYLDCANSGNSEMEAVESALKRFSHYLDLADGRNLEVEAEESVLTDAALVFCGHAANTHPGLVIVRENYDLKASLLIDELEWMLCGLDKSEGLYRTAYQEESIRDRITLLETLLRDDDKPRGWWHDEQAIHGFVTKLKSLVNDDAGTNQEQPDNGSDQASCCGDHQEGAVYESHLQTDNVSDQASCCGDHQEGTSHLHWDNGSDYASSCCDYEEEASQH